MSPDDIATALHPAGDGFELPHDPDAEVEDDGLFVADLSELDAYLIALLHRDNEDDIDDDVVFDDPTEIAQVQEAGIDLDDGDEPEPRMIPDPRQCPLGGFEMLEPEPGDPADDVAA
jgi:hypothetical protein